jgi:hypothetical protein
VGSGLSAVPDGIEAVTASVGAIEKPPLVVELRVAVHFCDRMVEMSIGTP